MSDANTVTEQISTVSATTPSTAEGSDTAASGRSGGGQLNKHADRGKPSRVSGFLNRWLVFVALVVVWEIATRVAGSAFFPPPSQIVVAAGNQWFSGPASTLFLTDTALNDVFGSLGRIALSWAIATVVGVALGTLLGRSRTAMDYVGPLFNFIRAVPPPVLVPVFIVLLGVGVAMQTTVILMGVLWPILLNTVDGVRSVDQTKVDTARSFRTPRGQWLSMVVLPAAAPKIFAGLRVSLSIALVLMVVSELVGSTNGIGYQLMFRQQEYDFPGMWAGIVLLGVLGYLLNTALLAVERRALNWKPA